MGEGKRSDSVMGIRMGNWGLKGILGWGIGNWEPR